MYPQLVPIPGYPVYHAPQLDSNYFLYDGMYSDFDQGDWYERLVQRAMAARVAR